MHSLILYDKFVDHPIFRNFKNDIYASTLDVSSYYISLYNKIPPIILIRFGYNIIINTTTKEIFI